MLPHVEYLPQHLLAHLKPETKRVIKPKSGAPMNPKFVWLSPHFLLNLLKHKKRFDIGISANSQVGCIRWRGLGLDSNAFERLVLDNPKW